MGIPNCLTTASTSYKNCLQDASIPLTEFINKNSKKTLIINFSIVPFKLFLTAPAVSIPGLVLCIANIIDERKWCWSYIDL